MDLAERVFSDVRIPSDSEEAQAAIKQLTDVSYLPLTRIKQLTAVCYRPLTLLLTADRFELPASYPPSNS